MKWNDFRKAQCGAEATSEPTPSGAPSPLTAQPPKATAARPSPAPVAAGNAVFPSTVSPKYSGESAGKARMQTCLRQMACCTKRGKILGKRPLNSRASISAATRPTHRDHAPEREINAAQGIEAELHAGGKGPGRAMIIPDPRAHDEGIDVMSSSSFLNLVVIARTSVVPTGRRDWNRSSRSSRASEHSSIPQVSADGSRHKSGA
jgi:hypothetical protein